MKTPREVLLDRHRAAEPQLDTVRQEVLAKVSRPVDKSLNNSVGDEVTSLIQPEAKTGDSLRRLLHSLRWHLAGMSAAWMLILLLNVDHSSNSTADAVARENGPSPHQILTALIENRREILQLIGPPVAESASLPPRRSEFRLPRAMA